MPIPGSDQASPTAKCGDPRPEAGGGLSAPISLPVLAVHPAGEADKRHIRKSKMGKWRAAALIGVNLLMAGHIALWISTGRARTLSPVEPSESMYTLERGLVNAGFVFFALAILSTFILGRWFCGWGCHIVALQDLCSWFMKRLGIKPKPFRSRVLLVAPVLLALYMFVWPTFKREVIKPLAGEQRWQTLAPYIGEVGPRPQIQPALLKQDFWETFPAWYVAVPFLALCGFGAAYFLGAKGYCTYGCPYGGFFAPADRLATGRILVTDACEHCGHCTSVCSSNVRVHEEVRDFGMVVDPGCMKCLDCVSVCPNDALYFGFAKPALLQTPARRRLYDLPLLAEIVLFFVGLGLFLAYRGVDVISGTGVDGVPMLMATGIGAVGVFLCWKLWQMLREPSVRVQSLQLKLKGRLRPAGWALGLLTVAMLAGGAWGGAVNYDLYASDVLLARLTPTMNEMLAPNYAAPPDQHALAGRVLAHLRRTAPRADGGWGWNGNVKAAALRAYLCMVQGDHAEAERWLKRTIDLDLRKNPRPAPDQIMALPYEMAKRGAQLPETLGFYGELVRRAPGSAEARFNYARLLMAGGDPGAAIAEADAAIGADPNNGHIAYALGQFLGSMNRGDLALKAFEQAARLDRGSAGARAGMGLSYAAMGNLGAAVEHLSEAVRLDPENPSYMHYLASALHDLGRDAEATELERRANEVQVRRGTPGDGR